MNRHHDRSVDRSWHRVRGTKSKAKPVTPGSRAEPTSDTSCPPRGPHHFVLLRLALRTLILLPSSALFHLSSSLLAKSFFYPPLPPTTVSPVYTSLPLSFLLRPAFVSLLSYSSVVPPAPSFRLSFSPHARRPTAVVHRAFALVARTCHSDCYQE